VGLGIIIKSRREIDAIRRSGHLARTVLEELGRLVKPGVTTEELDATAYRLITDAGAIPSPLNYHGFPKSICTSINEVVCHGIPGPRALVEGDIINIDVTTRLDGYHGDCSKTVLVGEVSDEARTLVDVTRECLERGIRVVRPGAEIGAIGETIQELADQCGYGVVREYCGHGIGREFHEEPRVLHYSEDGMFRGRKKRTPRMRAGMVFTIEPMINAGTYKTRTLDDGWTAVTADGSLSAQFEHTVVVTDTGFEVLTQ
jgi:methionyl aminopeptidase